MKVHDRVNRFHRRGSATLTTWIYQIAHNKAIDFFRASSKIQLEPLDDNLLVPERHEYVSRNTEQRLCLRDELEKLSAADQWVLLWRAQGFSYAQIAEWLKIKEKAARVRYFRAKRKLGITQEFSEEDDEPSDHGDSE